MFSESRVGEEVLVSSMYANLICSDVRWSPLEQRGDLPAFPALPRVCSEVLNFGENSRPVSGSPCQTRFCLGGRMNTVKEVGTKLNFTVGNIFSNFCDLYFPQKIYFLCKEFLRSIQGSVLTSRLYDVWLGVLDQRNEEEKLAAVQR